MNELFSGYVRLNGKQPAQRLKDGSFLRLKEVEPFPSYGGVLAPDTILIDIDDYEQSEILMNIVERFQLACKVVKTSRGKHFYFQGFPNDLGCKTHCKLAIGLTADIKVGSKMTYGVLKLDGTVRDVIYDIYDDEEYEKVPKFLLPISYCPEFTELFAGDGRNQTLFNYILTLQANGFTQSEARQTLDVINDYVLPEPLPKVELESVYRDEAFAENVFFEKGNFLFNKFAEFLKNQHSIVKISGQLHIYQGGVYVEGYTKIEHAMIKHLPMLSKAKRSEVMSYLDVLIMDRTTPAAADKIAFANGIYDLSEDLFMPFKNDIVITNKIDWDYDPNAYSEIADQTLDKLACGDADTRSLLEEVIGYTFYRRNELRKSFILLGDKANGKSTFLAMLHHLLGDDNTSALDLGELGDRFKTAELFGKLANIGDDIGDEFIANPAVFKKLVSGDRVNAERKGQDPFDFNSYAKLLFSANSMPRIKDKTGAVISRMILIPFNATFSKSDPDFDPYIKYKLQSPEVMSYLINLGLAGLKRVLRNQFFTLPEASARELAEYEIINNPIIEFFNEVSKNEIVNQQTGDIYGMYMAYCINHNVKPIGQNEFTKQTKKHYGLESVTRRIGGVRARLFVDPERS